MGVLSDNAIIGASAAGGYSIDQSLSCQSVTSGRLSRTLTSAGSVNPKWTFATWYKKGEPTTTVKGLYIFTASSVGAAAEVDVSWQNDITAGGGGIRSNGWSGAVSAWDWDMDDNAGSAGGLAFRDYGAWYHLCHVIDYTTSPYVFFYVNGVLQDPSTIYGLKNGAGYGTNYSPVSGDTFYIAGNSGTAGCPTGYQADTYWIEGQALNPVGTFGEINEDTGQFVPIEYTGTYTGNSFYLDYADSADFGTDQSGLGNDFTANALTADQQSLDTPTNNFATMNPLFKYWGGGSVINVMTFSEGNLKTAASGGYGLATGTIAPSSGKWYFEIAGITDAQTTVGAWDIDLLQASSATFSGLKNYRYYGQDGVVYGSGGATGTTYSTFGVGDVIGCALDLDNNKIYFAKNGTWQGSSDPAAGTNPLATDVTGAWVPACTADTSQSVKINFGQDSSFSGSETAQGNGGTGEDFYYTPPAGFKALNTDNLPDPAIALPADHFNTILWTGDGTSPRSFTGVGFSPDFTWTKNRTTGVSHMLYDTVRGTGATKSLESNAITIEGGGNASTYGYLSAFGSDGFTTTDGSGSPNYYFNENTKNFVSWNWKGGGTAVSNTDGSITSSVSANPTAGFSVVGYTSISTTVDETIGHGLSAAPEMVIVKNLDSAWNWDVYTAALTSGYDLKLNDTAAQTASRWSTTIPTASVVTLKYNYEHTSTNDYIAYCFHSVEGYSKVGSYVGNGVVDGPFAYTGFRPAFFLVKNISTGGTMWRLYDDKRSPYNPASLILYPDTTSVGTSTGHPVDLDSSGVKIRGTFSEVNTNGNIYIYLAFAESPFKTSNAR
jgi:hypothetical protein